MATSLKYFPRGLFSQQANSLRSFSSLAEAVLTDMEKAVTKKLKDALSTKSVSVKDQSGGCGAMFEIKVVADEFK